MKQFLCIAALALVLPTAVAYADDHAHKTASATLVNKAGREVGTATLIQGPNGVLIHVKVIGLSPGKHGLHLHSHGVCDAETGFKSAKGHVGKVKGAHGLLNPKGPEPGDIPNIFVGTDGTGEMEAYTAAVSLNGDRNDLLDANGSTFIIHEKPDDHLTQPIGGAGARVACGVITSN